MKKYLLALFAIISLSACSEKTYTVKEFMQDEALRDQFIAKCENGELRPEDMNCINSRQARITKYQNMHTLQERK